MTDTPEEIAKRMSAVAEDISHKGVIMPLSHIVDRLDEAASLIRQQAAEIERLTRERDEARAREVKVRWEDYGAFIGPFRVGMISQDEIDPPKWVPIVYFGTTGDVGLPESEARAAVEAEVRKMMEG
jgi:hypothetical protein